MDKWAFPILRVLETTLGHQNLNDLQALALLLKSPTTQAASNGLKLNWFSRTPPDKNQPQLSPSFHYCNRTLQLLKAHLKDTRRNSLLCKKLLEITRTQLYVLPGPPYALPAETSGCRRTKPVDSPNSSNYVPQFFVTQKGHFGLGMQEDNPHPWGNQDFCQDFRGLQLITMEVHTARSPDKLLTGN